MQTAEEIYLFVQVTLRKDLKISVIPIEIPKEVFEDRNGFARAFADFRSHILRVFRDRIEVHRVHKKMVLNESSGDSFIINFDIYENIGKLVTFFDGICVPTPTDGIEWNTEGRMDKRQELKNGRFEGRQIRWHPNGFKEEEFTEYDYAREGRYRKWYPNGQLEIETTYKNDQIHGRRKRMSEDGKILEDDLYENGKIVSS